jgi:hypothetical protein
MKKYIISTGVALIAITSVCAAESFPQARGTTTPGMMRGGKDMPMMPPTITTGDATVDAQIKALQQEMEAKIKAIRDEYQVKIKTAIGDKKVLNRPQNWSSTTPSGMMRGEPGERMMRGTGTPEHQMFNGSSTMRHDGDMMRGTSTRPHRGDLPTGQAVRGESTEDGNADTNEQGGVRGFFSRFFGR